MVDAAARLDEVPQLAKAYLLAKSAFNRAYCRFWHSEVQPCSDEIGWMVMDVFRREVEEFQFKLEREEQGINHAAWEVFRLELVGQADYRFEDAVAFVKWYGVLKNKIGRAIGHLYEFHGDSFADLVDAYPLAGRELVERALASHPKSERPRREGYLDEREVGDAVKEKLGSRWYKLICQGENYVLQALERACRKSYLHRVLTGQDAQITWTEDEQSAADFAGHFDD
jgi:hypothetical protein